MRCYLAKGLLTFVFNPKIINIELTTFVLEQKSNKKILTLIKDEDK